MASGERTFVQAIRHYCARHGIAVDLRSGGWLIAMRRGETRRFAFGYDIGLNSVIAHRLANDKSATAEVLALENVPCIPHHLFLNPSLGAHVAGSSWHEAMLDLLAQNPQGVVVKPNEGTSGRAVFKATIRDEIDRAVREVFSSSLGLVIAPYVEIEQEVRVILLDGKPMIVYRKQRPAVVGDGVRSLAELAAAAGQDKQLRELDAREANAIVPKGERRILNWRHNLDAGAQPVLMERGEVYAACANLAIDAANAIGIVFASIDVIRVDGAWKVLEINSGVMMEALGKLHPELVQATYDAALDRVFEEIS
ncbi:MULTISPECIES: RimK-like protein [unclassified Bradyrhizobium]|uniref:ATP-grasp domain-containing protein n=1 Tax=unclassified Bradyrhizobium TaxID=2631580 RepID=UPI001FF9871E|nr:MULTISPECIES: RimK-like protein [unclassified Bradyrhizobium]MCK1713286.1 RimK-like protein [Bradyrhizobium sp. 143]MCK1728332.1 RimK-like protein [Bradyrhizobium sp. 142]